MKELLADINKKLEYVIDRDHFEKFNEYGTSGFGYEGKTFSLNCGLDRKRIVTRLESIF
ncbi:MAG TPA: hypothetical protein VI112_03655 [Bacteroidia bacterium]